MCEESFYTVSSQKYNTLENEKKMDDDKLLLSIKSAECQIVANVMEDGQGLRNAWQFVNEFR